MVFLPKECYVKVVIICCLSWINYVQSFGASSSCGEQFSTRKDQDVFPKHRYRSRVIESKPISMPFECYVNCMKNCRCASYNICNGGKLCELNSEKKENNASLYEQSDECDYHEYQFSKKQPSEDCLDPCCSTSNNCPNGGRCQATCMKNNKRFRCDCPEGYAGDQCEIKATSCASYAKSSSRKNGLHVIYTSDGSKLSVFCHFTPQYAMTLVMSYSKQRCDAFDTYSLEQDFPRNEDAQKWSDYRLSLSNMEGIRDDGSTHWMYTCSYQTRGLSEVDYFRSKFSETDILTFRYRIETRCSRKLEYINIKGNSCEDCSTVIIQGPDGIFFINSNGIDCGGLTGVNRQVCQSNGKSVRYFGRCDCQDTQFSCSASPTSTTQLWFAHYLD